METGFYDKIMYKLLLYLHMEIVRYVHQRVDIKSSQSLQFVCISYIL